MRLAVYARSFSRHAGLGAALLSTLTNLVSPPVAAANQHRSHQTRTPVKHVIVIIGENRTFDHVYATYKPRHGQFISNLLSKGIVNQDGTPGWNYSRSAQYSALDNDEYSPEPDNKQIYDPIPPPSTSYVSTAPSDTAGSPFATSAVATSFETDLTSAFTPFLLTGASGLPQFGVDTRLDANTSGVYQITRKLSYDSYTGDPVHRFYQMWQQYDCKARQCEPMEPQRMLSRTCSPGLKSRSELEAMAIPSRRISTISRPVKAPSRWASTTCIRAMRLT